MKPTGKSVAAAAVQAVGMGYTYDEMDCQAFVEYCVKQAGGRMDYRGSNDMARGATLAGSGYGHGGRGSDDQADNSAAGGSGLVAVRAWRYL